MMLFPWRYVDILHIAWRWLFELIIRYNVSDLNVSQDFELMKNLYGYAGYRFARHTLKSLRPFTKKQHHVQLLTLPPHPRPRYFPPFF